MTPSVFSTRHTDLYTPRHWCQLKIDVRVGKKEKAWVPISRISRHLVNSVVIVEDDRFYSHWGVDFEEMLTSLSLNWKTKEYSRGASTITQQLAKNLFLGSERSLARKGQEFAITMMLEALLSKQRILEIYLNSVEWGEGVFGAEAAAQHYFRKSAAQLAPLEAARLVVVLWSSHSVESQFVLDAAMRGWNREVLIPVRIEAVDIPAPFNRLHTLDVVDWSGAQDHRVHALLDALAPRLAPRGEVYQ